MTTEAGRRLMGGYVAIDGNKAAAEEWVAAIEAEAVAAYKARLVEGVKDYQRRKGSEYVGHPDLIFAAVLRLIEETPA